VITEKDPPPDEMPDDWSGRKYPPVMCSLLASATRQILQPTDVPVDAVPVESRSLATGIVLDLLLPAAAAGYTLRGSPFVPSTRLPLEVGPRALGDVGAAVLLALPYLEKRYDARSFTVISAAGIFALNRAWAVLTDVFEVLRRNDLAQSGFRFANSGDLSPWH
jgi:hypothetical protein